MGTPEYARRILAQIRRTHDTFLVVTKPDRPTGRHRRMTPSPVAEWAQSQGIPLVKPASLVAVRHELEAFSPDYILTAAFGRILRPWLLDLPRYGAYNLHASLLPRWRGPNPIAWAILAGDSETGTTLMRMDAGIDTGPIVAQSAVAIEPDDTTGDLAVKLADAGAELWLAVLSSQGEGPLSARPQPEDGVTFAPKFASDAGRLDWGRSAVELDGWVRGMTPDPGAYTMLSELRVKILRAKAQDGEPRGRPGTAVLDGNEWLVASGRGMLRIGWIQPAGRRPMTPGDFVRGVRGERTCHLQ